MICLDNQSIGWTFVFIVIGVGFIVYATLPSSDSIPPTNAYSNINLNDTNSTVGVWLNATSSDHTLYIVTDGSIVFNTTQGLCPTC